MSPGEVISYIEPRKRWLDIDIRGLWKYRDLYVMYVRRDIVTQYKQTLLGPLWFLVQPMLTTVMYMFVFGGLAGIPTDGVPQPLFYLCGICLWTYFSNCFNACCYVFAANQGVFGKVYFPRLVVPLSSITSNLIKLGIQFCMFLMVLVYLMIFNGYRPSLGLINMLQASGLSPSLTLTSGILSSLALTLALVAMAGLHAMSWGLIVTSMTTKYRDLSMLISFGVQLLMYGTPVIYPLSFAPEQYRWLLSLNPLTSVFETFKFIFLGAGTFDILSLGYSLLFLCIGMFLAVVVFNHTEQRFMDTV